MSDKFGLDYLIKRNKTKGGGDAESRSAVAEARQEPTEVESEVTADIARATISIGNKVLLVLKQRKQPGNPTTSIKELVDEMGVDWETLNVVCKRLEQLNLLEIEPDKYGDHALRLTKAGEQFVASL